MYPSSLSPPIAINNASMRSQQHQQHQQHQQRSQRPANSSRRAPHLQLPSLPRFHPANFASQESSNASSPASAYNSPHPPSSPRQAQRQLSEAQRQLHLHHRELLVLNRGAKPMLSSQPVSPQLHPLGSPGPVTPLDLEQEDGYLIAGASGGMPMTDAAKQELMDRIIRTESHSARRTQERSASRSREHV